ncbi:hypothetical protein [Methanobacterium aggregans]|uniref:hypothetical protein n=1 Tax=Methanobacterium aggregans TaxID=1615586 RepID=UPI003210338A
MESKEVKITEQDVIDVMHVFDRVPSLILRGFVSRNANVVKSFKNQIDSYKNKLSEEDIAKVAKVIEMQVPELQELMNNVYKKTHKKQLKILSDPKAEPFITKNLKELKNVLDL